MKGYINNKEVEFEANETILSVARRNGQFVPTLCTLTCLGHTPGTCRVCLVDMKRKGMAEHHIVTSCDTPMEEGMEILTRTARVRERQRLQVELLLADHNQDCASCIRHGDCELQDVAQFVGLEHTHYHYPHFYRGRTLELNSPAIIRDMSKCIRCLRCVEVCREVQKTDVLVFSDKGLTTEIGIKDSTALGTSNCVSCGQCTLVCPVGALAVRDDTEQVIDYLYDPNITTVFQVAPAVRVAIGEEFHINNGSALMGKINTALKTIGADVVLDTNFTADLTIMEEGSELLQRVKEGGPLPLLTSCSPGWVNFIEKNYPHLLPHVSTAKSPQQMFGALAKTFLAQKMGIDPKYMRVISIMPCTAKKEEAKRSEFTQMGRPDVDVVLTTREFSRLLKREGLWLPDLEESECDNLYMGDHTGAGVIFGATGGVMEAAIRSVYYLVKGVELDPIDVKEIRGQSPFREATVDLGSGIGEVRVAVVHGLKAARDLVEKIESGEAQYHFVEVMACPGGCVGGGGQPRRKGEYQCFRDDRRKQLFALDKKAKVRQSHNNPLVQQLYKDFLGEPLSHKSHRLLHTSYTDRKRVVNHSIKEIWSQIKAEGKTGL
jgi:ferredoxin hydrogenase gamma subunit